MKIFSRISIGYLSLLVFAPIFLPQCAHSIIREVRIDDESERVPAAADCAKNLLKLINRGSPLAGIKKFEVLDAVMVNRLGLSEQALLRASMSGKNLEGQALDFSLHTPGEFANIQDRLKDRGVWIFMSATPPNLPGVRIQSGHFWIGAGDTVFDNYGGQVRSAKITAENLEGLTRETQYVVAQFYELNEDTVAMLNRFFHDRTWFANAGAPEYRTQFVTQPLTRDAGVPNGENCLTFSCPWFNERWLRQRPELKQAAREMGGMTVSEVPLKQIYNAPTSAAYRGTVIITANPKQMETALLTDSMATDEFGKQLILNETRSLDQ